MRTRNLVILVGVLVLATLTSLQLGAYPIGPRAALETLAGNGTAQQDLVLFGMRLPRLIVVILAGLALSLSGAILQAVSRNALADPGILGLTSGAGLAVMLQLYLTQESILHPTLSRPLAASLGAFSAAALVHLLAYKRGRLDPNRLLLAGIAVNAGLTAVTLIISMRLDRRLYDAAVMWTSGSASGKSWHDMVIMLPWLVLLVSMALTQTKALDVLELGDETARGIGLQVQPRRILLLVTAVGLAGTAVAVVGGVGFVGLLGPHIARRLVGPRHGLLLITAALTGAILMVAADAAARSVLAPVELPVGVVVALFGAPYFLYLMATAMKR